MEQISFFEEPYTLLNGGVAALKALRLAEAQDKFREYGELYRDFGAVEVYLKLAEFLHEGLAGIDRAAPDAPGHLWRLWKDFESHTTTMKIPGTGLLPDLMGVYFRMATTVMEALGMAAAPWFDEGLPTWPSLSGSRAPVTGPGRDGDLTLALAWLPAHAYTAGLFKPKIIRLKDEFTAFLGDFQVLEKRYRKDSSAQIGASLFFRAIILCDNETSLRLIKGMDFADIRRQMKEINPELFVNYLRVIKERKKTPR